MVFTLSSREIVIMRWFMYMIWWATSVVVWARFLSGLVRF